MERVAIPHLSGMPVWSNPSDAEFEALLNREPGDLKGYDCPICLNRGFIWHVDDGEKWTEPCRCMETRAGLQRLKKSGLEAAAELCTFARFQAAEDWQKNMLQTAKSFLADKNRQWMFVSGQSGCGRLLPIPPAVPLSCLPLSV